MGQIRHGHDTENICPKSFCPDANGGLYVNLTGPKRGDGRHTNKDRQGNQQPKQSWRHNVTDRGYPHHRQRINLAIQPH